MRSEDLLSQRFLMTTLRPVAASGCPDTLARLFLETGQGLMPQAQAAHILHTRVHPETGEVLETLGVGRSGAVQRILLDPVWAGANRTSTSGPDRSQVCARPVQFAAACPYQRCQLIQLVLDTGKTTGQRPKAALELHSALFYYAALRVFSVIDDVTLTAWFTALVGLDAEDFDFLRVVEDQMRRTPGVMAVDLQARDCDTRRRIQRIANRDVASPDPADHALHLVKTYLFLQHLSGQVATAPQGVERQVRFASEP